MSASMRDDEQAYEALLKKFPLRPIRNDEQNELAASICDELADRLAELSPGERDYFEVLTDLIAKYESRWEDEIAELTSQEAVEFLMEQNGLAQKDLIEEFGSASRVSEFLKGQRALSLEQARRLSARFKLNIAYFLGPAYRRKTSSSSTMDPWLQFFKQAEVTYRAFFDVLSRTVEENRKDWDNFLAQQTEGSISDITPKCLHAFKALISKGYIDVAPEWRGPLLVNEDAPPEYGRAVSEDKRKRPNSADPGKRRTCGDALNTMFNLAQCDFDRHPEFWNRTIDLSRGDPAIDEFGSELIRELSEW